MIATEFDYGITLYNHFRAVLHAVDSLNVKHELRSRKGKQINSVSCRHSQMIFLDISHSSLENRVLLFA